MKLRASGSFAMLSSDEESRAFLQSRLNLFSALLFWSLIVALAAMSLLYWQYPEIEPEHEATIVYISCGGLTLQAAIWRLFLVRRRLSIKVLYLIDGIYAIGTGLVFATVAILAMELRPSSYACMLYTSFLVLLRTIIVPSTGPRTAILGTLTFVPMTAAAVVIGLVRVQELPPAAFICSALIISAIVILFATLGSRIIYGLRRQVSEATQLGQYTLDQKIGEGGMGAVYRAHHALLRRPTAVKLLLPDRVGAKNLDRFEREVQHMSQLTHPNTVAVFDYGRNLEGIFYYAMEYLGGIDLEQLVSKFGPQPAGRTVNILAQVCGALKEAHGAGIIHRDIKPANIILCERGGMADVAKVVDFGLVKEIATDITMSTQVILGTPGYLAPEGLTAPDTVGPPVDLYALGAVGYFLLTGTLVFDGVTAMEICVKHVSIAPVPPSRVAPNPVPAELDELIMACLSKQPAARPTAATLGKLLAGVPATTGWDEDRATEWWSAFHKLEPRTDVPNSAPTMMITIDFGKRKSVH